MTLNLFESKTRPQRSKRPDGQPRKTSQTTSKKQSSILTTALSGLVLMLFLGGCKSSPTTNASSMQPDSGQSLTISVVDESNSSDSTHQKAGSSNAKVNRETETTSSRTPASSRLKTLTPGQFENGIAFQNIHYSLRLPDQFASNESYPLFVHLPGYEGEWQFGSGANLQEDFPEAALAINDSMIIASLQLNGWDEQSGIETNELVEYLINTLPVNPDQVYLPVVPGINSTEGKCSVHVVALFLGISYSLLAMKYAPVTRICINTVYNINA